MRFIPAIALGLLPLAAMAQAEAPDPEPPAAAEARLGAGSPEAVAAALTTGDRRRESYITRRRLLRRWHASNAAELRDLRPVY